MAEGVYAQARISRGRVRIGEYDAAGPDRAGHDAGLDDAAAYRPRGLVPATARDGRPHGKPRQGSRLGVNVARNLDAFGAFGHEGARDASRRQNLFGPAPVLDVQQGCPTGVRDLGRMDAGQLVSDVVFRQQDLDHLVIGLPLVVS